MWPCPLSSGLSYCECLHTLYGTISEQMPYIFTIVGLHWYRCWHMWHHLQYTLSCLNLTFCNITTVTHQWLLSTLQWHQVSHSGRFHPLYLSRVHMYHPPSDLWFCRNLTDFLSPKADLPLLSSWQQSVRLVMQNRALSPPPMSSRITILICYISEWEPDITLNSPGRERYQCHYASVLKTCMLCI